ncbi:ATP-dependent zinc metalloprotease FtsH [Anaeromyxobacter sp. Fw109-5]|uniref:ATP-dependent zinc metalloprotease FtsH n=1 Tax=Anaeromyxobacter sp. (strain Fw109-5) TaxID=404589 RepID=UPI0000ED8BC0|nr:ATP-dependent metalloprotease FtsH [Anaeromyxobacter sp. Fw109-5]
MPDDKKPHGQRGERGSRQGPQTRVPLASPAAWLVLIALAVFLFRAFQDVGVRRIPYSQFKDMVRQSSFERVVIGPDWVRGIPKPVESGSEGAKAEGEKSEKGGQALPYVATRIPGGDSELVPLVEKAGVPYDAVSGGGMGDLFWVWVAPIALGLLFWAWIMRRMSGQMGQGPPGVMAFGKSRARVHMEPDTGITFQDVAGIDEAVEELQEIVEFLKTPEKYRRLGGRIPKGVLLVGPPGTGKTLLARATAGEAGVPFFSLSGSEFVEMFVGVGAARVRDLFAQATQKAPCIVFIDELDALGKSRNSGVVGGHDEREQTLNQLLAEMDGFDARASLIVMGATNRPEILDPALMRPGRFDRQVLVDRPDKRGREKILQIHAKNVKLGADVDLRSIAVRTPGFAGADLANVVNEAALLAARRNKSAVTRSEFEEAIERVVAGLEKKSRRINEREKEIVAFHEAGHALVSWMLPHADRVTKVSIIPRGLGALGYTLQLPIEDRYLLTRSELRDRMAGLMGGRVAEEEVFGEPSTGASNDLQQATGLARMMVRDYGMSEALGPIALNEERAPSFLGKAFETRTYSEQTALEVDREVQSLVLEAQQRARETVRRNRERLDAMAARLLTAEVVEEEEMTRLWGPKVARPDTIHGPGHTEAPPEHPARPVAMAEEHRDTWGAPQAVAGTAPGDHE